MPPAPLNDPDGAQLDKGRFALGSAGAKVKSAIDSTISNLEARPPKCAGNCTPVFDPFSFVTTEPTHTDKTCSGGKPPAIFSRTFSSTKTNPKDCIKKIEGEQVDFFSETVVNPFIDAPFYRPNEEGKKLMREQCPADLCSYYTTQRVEKHYNYDSLHQIAWVHIRLCLICEVWTA